LAILVGDQHAVSLMQGDLRFTNVNLKSHAGTLSAIRTKTQMPWYRFPDPDSESLQELSELLRSPRPENE
jgi:hypothetical protein